ncbi:unknown [Betafusellovirus yellowstonense]|uniref:Uncharacterized protein n=1 Tax=Betafusellovirus yellowstonense TaxID=693629 RepID=D1GFA2_9VIRU|nr:hypothetical protein SSSV1_gp18 [Acidianus spindle-shaped virus 1]ACZ35803.1 unknown [Acidianus spindle-shaped virus 1]
MEVPEEKFKEKIVNQNSIFFVITNSKDSMTNYIHLTVEENGEKVINDKRFIDEGIEFETVIQKLELLYKLNADMISQEEIRKELYATIAKLLSFFM